MEVLEFTSAFDPDATDRTGARRSDLAGTPGHWARAFACAALVRAYSDADIRATCTGVYNPRLIPLRESLERLDAGLEREAMAAIAWFILCLSEEDHLDEQVSPGSCCFGWR